MIMMHLDTVIKLDSLQDLWTIDTNAQFETMSGIDTEGTYIVFYKIGKQYYSVRLNS